MQGADSFVTKADLELATARLEGQIAQVAGQFRGDLRVDVARLEVLIERTTVTQIRWLVGLTFGLYGLMFGLILFVVARELSH